jgi:DNA-binding MarR family transcriptional regulator
MVRRDPCPDDRRGILAVLTDEGYAGLVEAAPGHVEEVRRAFFDPLEEADVAALGAVLRKVHAALRSS